MISDSQAKLLVLRLLGAFDSTRTPLPLLCIWLWVSCGLHMVFSKIELWFCFFLFFFIFPLPVQSFHDNESCFAAYQKYAMGCRWAVVLHAPRCDMKVHSQLGSAAKLCKAQGNEPATATSITGPQFGVVFIFNCLQIYNFHAFI